jgi:hypothetical protein
MPGLSGGVSSECDARRRHLRHGARSTTLVPKALALRPTSASPALGAKEALAREQAVRAEEHGEKAEESYRRAAEVDPDRDPEQPESTRRDG